MLPAPVLAACVAHVGEVTDVRDLGGLGSGRVARVTGPVGRVVAKGGGHPREAAVYSLLAATLAGAGVRLPACRQVVEVDGRPWLLLEHLPAPLPRSRCGADPEVVAVLRSLHCLDPDALTVLDPFRPRWDDGLHEAGLAALGLGGPSREVVERARERAPRFLDPVTVVSADPNPLNWRLDDRGGVVLLDWERIGLAGPALDLAILLPGLPTAEEARRAVTAYAADVRPGDVLAAKVWTLLEFATDRGEDPDRVAVLTRVAADVDQWLRSIDSHLAEV